MRLVLATCLLAACGRLGFGADDAGDAGVGDDAAPGPSIVELALRGGTACVRTSDGRAACWGSNTNGELGRGSTAPTGEPQLLPLAGLTQIVTGEFSTYAIDADGTLWGWGSNQSGQLGQGSVGGQVLSPVTIPVPEPVIAAAASQYHACAITRGRELYCWGGNLCGGLGTQDTAERLVPTKVGGLAGLEHVVMNDYETCVTDAAGDVRCFGGVYTDACIGQHLVPTAPQGLPAVRDIQGGCHMSMCAADVSGSAWCWGIDTLGNLGDGSVQTHVEPRRVAQVANARHVGTGFAVSCAASDASTSCWGDNTRGQLGVGDESVVQAIVPVDLAALDNLTLEELEVGCAAVCARAGNDVYCWGQNQTALIDASEVDAFAPRKLSL